MEQIVNPERIRKICKKKKRTLVDNKIIQDGLDAVIKKYLDVHTITKPGWRPYRLEYSRKN